MGIAAPKARSKGATPGFYVAHHRWLDADHGPDTLYKVGHTGDLRRRLNDDAYVTCFPPGFSFVYTVETRSKDEAHRLETGVLHCAAARRIERDSGPPSELVRMSRREIVDLALHVTDQLKITGTVCKDNPTYPRPPLRRANTTGDSGSAGLQVMTTGDLESLRGFVIPPPQTLDDDVDDILGNFALEPSATPPVPQVRETQASPQIRKTAEDYLREARVQVSVDEIVVDAEDEDFADAFILGGGEIADLCSDFDALNIINGASPSYSPRLSGALACALWVSSVRSAADSSSVL